MRLRKLNDGVELPEKVNPGLYINARSNRRVDVRSGENIAIATGVEISVARGELVTISGPNVVTYVIEPCKYTELFVMVANRGDRLLMIYPGQVLAEIIVVKKAARTAASTPKTRGQRKPKKTTLTGSATIAKAPGFHNKKPCDGC